MGTIVEEEMTKPKLINAHPVFVDRIRNVERSMESKFGNKWSDSKITKHLADNLDWDKIFSPMAESKFEKKRGRYLVDLGGLKHQK